VPLIYVENISKNEKNLCTNKWQIMTFLDHGLTNFVPTFKRKLSQKIEKFLCKKIQPIMAHVLMNFMFTFKNHEFKNLRKICDKFFCRHGFLISCFNKC